VAGVAPGQAYVIASYANLADTTIITVVPRPDSTGQTPPPPPPAPAPRPTTFDATITVLGFVPGADTSVTGSTLVPGAIVTLTLLPPMAGDTLPTGITPVTTPIMFGTVTVNAQSQARFSAVPQSRFRIDVVTSADSPWQGASHTSGPPIVATYGRLVTLQKR
jgi:hypothetical protein